MSSYIYSNVIHLDAKSEQQPKEKLSGLAAFSLDYVVKWPVSLVINRKVILKRLIKMLKTYLVVH